MPGEKIREEVLGGEVPKCEICEEERKVQEQQRKKGKKRKNGWDDDEDDDEDEDDDIIEGIMKVRHTPYNSIPSCLFAKLTISPI